MSNTPTLVLGSKNYSSWSLRPWLFLRKVGFEFSEQMIYFDAPDYQAQIAALSPSRRVPVLIEDELTIWDSLAICEYAAERTGRGLPPDPLTRALARSAAAEMHSGFQALREAWPMNVRALAVRAPASVGLRADLARIDTLWSELRRRCGTAGPWLCGEFSLVDAMFAPVVFRCRTYGAALNPLAEGYVKHVLSDALLQEWQMAAQREGHPLAEVDRIGTVQAP
jgi:glutathione S-transferase